MVTQIVKTYQKRLSKFFRIWLIGAILLFFTTLVFTTTYVPQRASPEDFAYALYWVSISVLKVAYLNILLYIGFFLKPVVPNKFKS